MKPSQNFTTRRATKLAAAAGAVLALAAIPLAVPAFAHHSFAMFDSSQNKTLEGTVKEFQWTNPHAWIMLTVAKDGESEDWAVEMMGPGVSRGRVGPRRRLSPACPSSSSCILCATVPMADSSLRRPCPMAPTWAATPRGSRALPLAGPRSPICGPAQTVRRVPISRDRQHCTFGPLLRCCKCTTPGRIHPPW